MTIHVAPHVGTLPAITRPNTGPTARLVALPQLDAGLPTTLSAVDEHLAGIERARQAQLDLLPCGPGNAVTTAHRRTVELILEHARAARARVRAGTYGLCTRCSAPLHRRLLENQPWQASCADCAPSGAL